MLLLHLIHPLFNLGANVFAALATGKASRKILKIEDENAKRKSLDVGLGTVPDIDILGQDIAYGLKIPDQISSVFKYLGPHRGELHKLLNQLGYGGVINYLITSLKERKLYSKNSIKSFASGSLIALSHSLVDLFSGGAVPIGFGYEIELYKSLTGNDLGLFYHGAIMTASILYLNRERISKALKKSI